MLTTTKRQPQSLSPAVQKLQAAADLAIQRNSADEFEIFERQLNEFDALVRETKQELWSDAAQTAIQHLHNDDALTTADMELIRTFLISDAESYLEHENNFSCWITELERLMDEIGRRSTDINRDSIQDLRGVLKDAIRLAPDIRNYLEEKARVEKFNAGMKNLNKTTRQMLVKLLNEQMSSDRR